MTISMAYLLRAALRSVSKVIRVVYFIERKKIFVFHGSDPGSLPEAWIVFEGPRGTSGAYDPRRINVRPDRIRIRDRRHDR
jgi:hypothetical protein